MYVYMRVCTVCMYVCIYILCIMYVLCMYVLCMYVLCMYVCMYCVCMYVCMYCVCMYCGNCACVYTVCTVENVINVFILMHACMYVWMDVCGCMYVNLNEWRSVKVLGRLGLDSLYVCIMWMFLCMYVCMYACMYGRCVRIAMRTT